MEKGFNDKELADIMSEIESLEREFASETPAPEAQEQEVVTPVMKEFVQAPVESVLPQPKVVAVPAPQSRPYKAASAPACLSFKVEGEMSVSLKFEVNGQVVSLEVGEQGLEIETESGAKFILPLQGKHQTRQAA